MTKRKPSTYIFFLSCLFFHMASCFAHSVTPMLFTELGIGSHMFGIVLAVMLAVNFTVSPFWGKLNGTIPSKISLCIGCLGYALGQFFFAIARTEMQFTLARAFTGLFTAACYVSILTYTLSLSDDPREQGANLTIVATIQMVGNAFGYLVGGLLGEISIATTFVAQVGTLITCTVVFWLACRKDRDPVLEKGSIGRIVRQSNPLSALLDGRKFMTPALLILFICVMLQAIGITTYDQSSNFYLRDVFGFTSGYNGVIKGVTGLLTLCLNLFITIKLVRRYAPPRIITGLYALCSVFMAGVVFGTNQMTFIVFNVLFYSAGAAILPLLQRTLTQRADPQYSSLAMGFYTSMTSLGSIIGALSSGLLYALTPGAPFVMGLGAFVIALILAATKL